MTTRERMQSGKLYFCTDEEIAKEQLECLEILYDYNHTRPSESQKREQILKNLLAEIGENCYIEPPLHANWGKYTHFGNNVYANFNLTLVDDTDIFVGDNVMFGPNVIIATAGHPVDPRYGKKSPSLTFPSELARMFGSGQANRIARGNDWGSFSHRSRERCYKRYPTQCGCGRKPVPGAA